MKLPGSVTLQHKEAKNVTFSLKTLVNLQLRGQIRMQEAV